MGLIRRYQWYKRFFQLVFVLNTLFVCTGFVALSRWIRFRDPTELELMFVGLGVLVFGVILPGYVLYEISKRMMEIKRQTESLVVKYVSEWINALDEYEGEEPLQNPKFWLNMALLLFETVGDNSQHPGLQAMAEIAPMLRREIRNSSTTKSKKRKSGASEE